MADSIESFFSAWGASEDARDGLITSAVASDVVYTDPRGTVEGPAALCEYVAQFTANAPGAAAEVAERSEGEETDVRVRFFGEGWEQFGRYKVRLNAAAKITHITGIAEAKA